MSAAAVVIGDRPLTEYLPLQQKGADSEVVTQFSMNDVDALGLLKMDFLGLRNLDVIDKAVELIGGVDITKIPLDDKKTYEMLQEGQRLRKQGVDVAVGRDVWTRAQGLQHLRTALGEGHACIVLPDTRMGRHVEAPFLAGRIRIGLGAFMLAQLADSPLLPFFAVHLERPPRFRLEVLPPLPPSASSGTPPTDAVSEFVRIYETYARSHPHQMSGLQPIFDDGPADTTGERYCINGCALEFKPED